MKKVLFLDRDGTLITEPEDEQVDTLDKMEFYPEVFQNMAKIASLDFELVIVTNQDGLGTPSFPKEDFLKVQEKFIKAFENEGVVFNDVLIDNSFPEDNSPNRKPQTGMLVKYMEGDYDLENSYVIGDRLTDMELAKNLGTKGIFLQTSRQLGDNELNSTPEELEETIVKTTAKWNDIYEFLRLKSRTAVIRRTTKETDIEVELYIDGQGTAEISTGIAFFDHMLEQISKHASVDLNIKVKGDLQVDEHHTIEDTALALGEVFNNALGDKAGIERYGFCLPMDDCLAQVAIDFGGRNWIEWDAEFKREKIGEMPTEMFFHFFKSFSDAAKCNLNIKAEGMNEHHKIEAIFKSFAKAIKKAIKRDINNMNLPTTKGVL
ncbi:MAG: bifunctional histidinol-phosphatase/imidazoleglycerol-phosphate dehydratase [Flavobacteriales bacterium]|nr:MAG: bifunctional histidinol-phosphatase/imidazoleglycerol-phosphate dehydratase [Flavobacteriales bacterium]